MTTKKYNEIIKEYHALGSMTKADYGWLIDDRINRDNRVTYLELALHDLLESMEREKSLVKEHLIKRKEGDETVIRLTVKLRVLERYIKHIKNI